MPASCADPPTTFEAVVSVAIPEQKEETYLKYNNPFASELAELQAGFDRASEKIRDLSSQLNWFQRFDPDAAHGSLKATERAIFTAYNQLETAKQKVNAQQLKVGQLKECSSPGFDPRYWFSSERAIAQRQLPVARQDMATLQRECDELKVRIQTNEQLAKKVQGDISRSRSFDELLAQATLRSLQAELERLEPQLFSLRNRKVDLDSKLEVLLRSLTEREMKRKQLAHELSCAQQYEENLTNAQTPKERAVLHGECEREFGNSKPMMVVRARRGALQPVEADIQKLTERINHIIKCSVRDVRTLVIDGNNLCYQQNEFIGFSALKSLVPQLALKYEVQLIFDSGIRGKLRMKDSEIRGCFPQALVHVVASKIKADETILDAAGGDKHFFVISNDRFADFPEKNVVLQGRILRHEIFDDSVRIHDLSISAAFCRSGRRSTATA